MNRFGGLPQRSVNSAVLMIDKPLWDRAPTAAAVQAAYPRKAKGAGYIVYRCAFDSKGAAADCSVVSQQGDAWFIFAAQSLLRSFVLSPVPSDGKHLRTVADIPFSFPAPGAPAPPSPPPRWVRTLTPKAAATLYPLAARAAKVSEGVGVVDCMISDEGHLFDCRIAREFPANLGFGEAALKGAEVMSMNPWSADGRPMGGRRINLPVRLQLESAPTPIDAP